MTLRRILDAIFPKKAPALVADLHQDLAHQPPHVQLDPTRQDARSRRDSDLSPPDHPDGLLRTCAPDPDDKGVHRPRARTEASVTNS